MKQRRKRQEDPFVLLGNPILRRTLTRDRKIHLFAHFLVQENEIRLSPRLKQLISSQDMASILNSESSKIEDFFAQPVFGLQTTAATWTYYLRLLERHADRINRFVPQRAAYELALSQGDYIACKKALQQCQEECGDSFWWIRSTLLVLSDQGLSEEVDNFADLCRARTTRFDVPDLIKRMHVMTHSDVTMSELEATQSYIAEFQEAQYTNYAALLSHLFVPDPISGRTSSADLLEAVQLFPAVDQYQMLLQVLVSRAAEVVTEQGRFSAPESGFVKALSMVVNDPVLRRVDNIRKAELAHQLSAAGSQLLEAYETGNHVQVSDRFRSDLLRYEDPLAFINLVAKSRATEDTRRFRDLSDDAKGPLGALISNVAKLYKLTDERARTQEFVISRAVKLNHLFSRHQVQLSLYLAMPHHFTEAARRRAAALAVIACPETTPLADAQLKPSEFGRKYGDVAHYTAVRYRRLKREICDSLIKGARLSNVVAKFEELQRIVPLRKDYLELLSESCVFLTELEYLIAVAADELVANPESYICFPMDRLIEEIEKNRLISIAAIVIAFYYQKLVSANKDYVLHELLEDYLADSKKTLPSELLENKVVLTELEKLFFKDICSVDVLDFLSAFQNANQLRAERIRILDFLSALGAIDSKSRILEVEEMVTRAFIDARTLEFTRWKVSVNDQAIRKKNVDRVKPLLAYFKEAPDSDDNGVRILEGSSASAPRTGYVLGNKNATVIRLIDLVQTSFLFDENDGLDKTLSTEIRHGFFSNLIRARLEDFHLITEKNEKSIYKTNEYWRARNAFVADAGWQRIDACLQKFSSSVNSLLVEAEEWMKISQSSTENANRMFQYQIFSQDLSYIRTLAELSSRPETIIDEILLRLWTVTEKHLAAVRERINGEFRSRLHKLITQLSEDLATAKREAALVELTSAVTQVAGLINEDVSKVAEWFNRAPDTSRTPATFGDVIRIALNSFAELKRPHTKPALALRGDVENLSVEGRSVKPLTIAIINLLDNCYRHSGLWLDTCVRINAEVLNDGMVCLQIENDVSPAKSSEYSEDRIESISKKITDRSNAALSRSEGGTGLPKVYRELSSLSKRKIDLAFDGKNFSVTIAYEQNDTSR
jgi:hypothetical protein